MRNFLFRMIFILLSGSLSLSAYSQTANLKFKAIKKELSGRYSHGSHTQASWLMGKVNLEIIFGELYGRAIIGQRFQWKWKDNATFHGLTGGMMSLEALKRYPSLYKRFTSLKPEYIRFTVPVNYTEDTLHGAYSIGESKMEIELVEKDISSSVSDPYNMGAHKGFRYFSPEWEEFDRYTQSDIRTQDLRYIGRKGNRLSSINSKQRNAINSEFNLTYSRKFSINPAALEVDEIRWPDTEMQNIFREFIRNEYKSFKATLKTTRATLAQELNDDADSQTFWLGVNINIDDYETNQSTQDSRLSKTLKSATAKQVRQLKNLANILKKINMDKSVFRNKMINFFSDPNTFPSLVRTNIDDEVTRHDFKMNGTIKIPRKNLRKVNTVVNDILKFNAQRSGSSVKSVLLYNYGINEIKLELNYNDGTKLIHREVVKRSGNKIPLRATLIWDYDKYEYEKSDIDIALSKKESCREDDFLVYYENNKNTSRNSQMELDVDNTEGFGPENISIHDGGNYNYGYFCITNHTSTVPANAKVVIFKDEVITQVGNDYVWDYEFENEKEREWIKIPGTYELGGY